MTKWSKISTSASIDKTRRLWVNTWWIKWTKCPCSSKITNEWLNVTDGAIPLVLPLKELDHLPPHLCPHPIGQVQLVIPRLRCTPVVPAVGLELPHYPVHLLSGGPSAPGVKSGGTLLTVQSVAGVYPVIDEVKLLTSVSVSRGRGPLSVNQTILGG